MNILITSTEYPPYPLAGSGMYAINLSEVLSADHRVTVLAPYYGAGAFKEKHNNIEILRLKNWFFSLINTIGPSPLKTNKKLFDRRIAFSTVLKAFFKKNTILNDFDILHFINVQEAAYVNIALLTKRIPIVVSCNDYYTYSDDAHSRIDYPRYEKALRSIYRKFMKNHHRRIFSAAEKIIVNCEYSRTLLADVYPRLASKFALVYRGISFSGADVPVPSLKYTSKKVSFIGANMERKGGLDLVRAIPSVVKRFPGAHFTMVGSASQGTMTEIKKILKNSGCCTNVTFYTHRSPAESRAIIRESNVFVMPSIIEALAQVYIESLLFKTPVVATRVGGTPEIITDEFGRLVEPHNPAILAEAIISILSNPHMAQTMGEKGRNFVIATRSRERMAHNTLSVYRSVLGTQH